MNDNAKKWVAALRSGDYKQGQNYLCQGDCYCCLGVACELFIKEGGELNKIQKNNYYQYGGKDGHLPEIVRDWLGLTFPQASWGNNSLLLLNDNEELDFNQIADVIESEPEGLFK